MPTPLEARDAVLQQQQHQSHHHHRPRPPATDLSLAALAEVAGVRAPDVIAEEGEEEGEGRVVCFAS